MKLTPEIAFDIVSSFIDVPDHVQEELKAALRGDVRIAGVDYEDGDYAPTYEDVFLDEVIEVCKKHGFSLGHEDTNGAFQVMPYDEELTDWLLQARHIKKP